VAESRAKLVYIYKKIIIKELVVLKGIWSEVSKYYLLFYLLSSPLNRSLIRFLFYSLDYLYKY
jgi:hypothetical protein